MKLLPSEAEALIESSLPSREAWIEILVKTLYGKEEASRFPRGKRGLKYGDHRQEGPEAWGRFPRGKRGLKFHQRKMTDAEFEVASLAGSVD